MFIEFCIAIDAVYRFGTMCSENNELFHVCECVDEWRQREDIGGSRVSSPLLYSNRMVERGIVVLYSARLDNMSLNGTPTVSPVSA